MCIRDSKKIVINQGLGMAVADKKIIEVAINEMTAITGQKDVYKRQSQWIASWCDFDVR